MNKDGPDPIVAYLSKQLWNCRDEMACRRMAEDIRKEQAKEYARLLQAAKALYFAARWQADRPCDAALLWTELRDAAGIAPGSGTAAGV